MTHRQEMMEAVTRASDVQYLANWLALLGSVVRNWSSSKAIAIMHGHEQENAYHRAWDRRRKKGEA